MTAADHANTAQQARAKIVAALNLTPLVPPQADDETTNVVNEAWNGLHDLMTVLDALEAQAAALGNDGLLLSERHRADAAEAERNALAESGRIAAKRYGQEHERRVASEADRDRLTKALVSDSFLRDRLEAERDRLTDALRKIERFANYGVASSHIGYLVRAALARTENTP